MLNLDDLSEQEKLKLAACNNSDEIKTSKFSFNTDIEQNIISGMIHDRIFINQARFLLQPNYFSNPARELICTVILKYFDDYHIVPPRHILEYEIVNAAQKINRPEDVFLYELEAIYANYEPSIQVREWLLDQVEEFARFQALKLAYSKTVDIALGFDKDKWVKIWDILKVPFQISRNRDYGMDYFHTVEEWFQRQKTKKENKEVFTTGFNRIDLDMGDGGPSRGELYAWMGSSGVGKSNLLVKTALANIFLGMKVLFLSLEIDEDKVAKRFHAQLTKTDIHDVLNKEDFVVKNVKDALSDLNDTFSEKVKKYQDDRFLIIKQFPAGTLDINGMRSYIAQMYNENFVPDVVVVDYVGEMKDVAGMDVWQSRQILCRDLRALGTEMNYCTWTALQPNRSGKDAQKAEGVMDDSNLGDSYGQIRVFDGLWSINQTKEEKEASIARLFNVKLRDGKSSTTFPVYLDPKTLNIEEITADEYRHRKSIAGDKKANEINIDSKLDRIQKLKEEQ